MTDKEKYIEFCKEETNIPIFSQPWWLDIVTDGNWNVILIEKKNQTIASLPYYILKKSGFKVLAMPKLTQKMGLYIKYPEGQKYESRLAYENEIAQEIINRLPKIDSFSCNFDISYSNWLGWYWNGFSQTTRYTFRIDTKESEDELLKKIATGARQRIKKYLKGDNDFTIEQSLSPQEYYDVCKTTYERQNIPIPYSYPVFEGLYTESLARNQGKIFVARDMSGEILAVSFLVWDTTTMYDLISAINYKANRQDIRTILLYLGIMEAKKRDIIFDCEGSMIKGVNTFYRQIGGTQTPYYCIYKSISLKYKMFENIKGLARAILGK